MKPKDKIGKCIDHWNIELQLTALGLIEGNQQATESFRNGMVQTDEEGNTSPKPDPASLALLGLFKELEEKQRIIFEHETRKQLKD